MFMHGQDRKLQDLEYDVIHNKAIIKEKALYLIKCELSQLAVSANRIRRHFCGESFDTCSLANGKSGGCTEDCKFCAQSARHNTGVKVGGILNEEEAIFRACASEEAGINRFDMVTAGRTLTNSEVKELCDRAYAIRRFCKNIKLCSSNGLLTYDQLRWLKNAGFTRYHCNLETSERYFPKVCSTHTYKEKVLTIKRAKRAELEVCSGGIFGIGENWEDRIDLAFALKKLEVKSIPINFLNPIKGTKYAKMSHLPIEDALRIVAIFRYILPDTSIRIAAGRKYYEKTSELFFMTGANATLTGDMLTIPGLSFEEDKKMLTKLGFDLNSTIEEMKQAQ